MSTRRFITQSLMPLILLATLVTEALAQSTNRFEVHYSGGEGSFTMQNNSSFGPPENTYNSEGHSVRIQFNKPNSSKKFQWSYFLLVSNARFELRPFGELLPTNLFAIGPGFVASSEAVAVGGALLYSNYQDGPSELHLPITSARIRFGRADGFYGVLGTFDYSYPIALTDVLNFEIHQSLGRKFKLDAGGYMGILSMSDHLVTPGIVLQLSYFHFQGKLLYRHMNEPSNTTFPYPKLIYSVSIFL